MLRHVLLDQILDKQWHRCSKLTHARLQHYIKLLLLIQIMLMFVCEDSMISILCAQLVLWEWRMIKMVTGLLTGMPKWHSPVIKEAEGLYVLSLIMCLSLNITNIPSADKRRTNWKEGFMQSCFHLDYSVERFIKVWLYTLHYLIYVIMLTPVVHW